MNLTQINKGFDFLTAPFTVLNPIAALALVGLTSAIVILSIVKKMANQGEIQLHKAIILGNFLEIAIYRDQFRRVMICQAQALKHNLLYLRCFIPPVLIMMIPMSIICLQIEYRLGSAPLEPKHSFIIETRLNQGVAADKVTITTSPGIVIETPALRNIHTGLVFWRARLIKAGAQPFIKISLPNNDYVTKYLTVSGGANKGRFTPEKNKDNTLTEILTGGEDSIPAASAIEAVRVNYSPARYPFFIWHLSPIVYFFVLTLASGLLLKPVLKVKI